MNRCFGRLAFLFCLVTAGFSIPSYAQSDDDEARVHFRLGNAYHNSGRFPDAAREFQQAYDLSHRSALMYNTFVAWRNAGELGPAIAALQQYIPGLAPGDRERLQAQLENMQRDYASQQRALGREPPDATSSDETSDATSSDETSDAESPKPSNDVAASSTSAGERATPDPITTAAADGARPEHTSGQVAPWILSASGGALLFGGAVTGIMALSAQNDLKDRCDANGICPSGWESKRDRGRRLAVLSDVLMIGGGVVVAGGLLWLVLGRHPSSERDPALAVLCAPGGCAASARFAF